MQDASLAVQCDLVEQRLAAGRMPILRIDALVDRQDAYPTGLNFGLLFKKASNRTQTGS